MTTDDALSDDWLKARWSGQRQRQALRGFERLKAILWKRSLGIYEWLILGGNPWFRRLSFHLFYFTFGLDLHARQRVHQAADVFGETPMLTLVHVLQRAEAGADSKLPEPFIDLGCGRGLSCLCASSLGMQALGYEKERAWVEAARRVAKRLELPCSFAAEDFLLADLPSSGTYFVVATAYPEGLRLELEKRFCALLPETVFITVDWRLADASFSLLWEGRLPVNWGTADFTVWRRRDSF